MVYLYCDLTLKSDTSQTCTITIALADPDKEDESRWKLNRHRPSSLYLPVTSGKVHPDPQQPVFYDDKPYKDTTFGIVLRDAWGWKNNFCTPRDEAQKGEGGIAHEGNWREIKYAIYGEFCAS